MSDVAARTTETPAREKSPTASLSLISASGNAPPPRKSGDLTRLFELARASKAPAPAQAAAPAVTMPPEPAPVPEPVIAEPPAQEPEPIAEEASDPTPAAAPTVAPQPKFEALVDYWRFLRGSREFPTVSQVDRALVSERWPSSLLLAFTSMSSDPRAEPELARVTRLGRACADVESAVDYSPYATRWMLELGRAALRAAEPVEELARLSTADGSRGFRLMALPLGPAGAAPDSVLCELAPTSEAPRFGKRRVWLED